MNKITNILAIIFMLISILLFIRYALYMGEKESKRYFWVSFSSILVALAIVIFDLIVKNIN